MFAPMQVVTLDDGSSVELPSLYRDRPLALIFLRHLGCIFCREVVLSLNAYPEANMAFVALERAELCHQFRLRFESPHPVISDPSRTLYDAFSIGHAKLGQVLNPHTIGRGLMNMRSGLRNGRPSSDSMTLGAVFVINQEGIVVWEHRAKDIADNPSGAMIVEALEAATSPTPLAINR
ncbi:MAG: hypothetical protein C4320_00180 [Armatimonadota bacterium]